MSKLIKMVGGSFAVLALSFVTMGATQASAQGVATADTAVIANSPIPPSVYNIYPGGYGGYYGGFGGVFGGSNLTGSLSNLALLDTLFNRNRLFNNNLNLGDFVLLNSAFDNSNINRNNFADLFALGRIFGNSNSIFNDRGTSLGDILITDQLFNR
jgi:hypothetical protein